MKRFTPFAIFFAIAALVIGFAVPGSAASTVAQGFLATSPGPTAALAFSGQLQCEVAVNAPGTLAATPQYSSDGVTWVPATVIGNGSINQPGVYIGTNPVAAGYGFLRLNISSFSGSQLSGQLACGDNLPPANSGGTGAVSSVNGGACITVSPITGDTIVTYTCATPVPLTVDTPLVLSTPGNDSINIACPGCGGGGGGGTAIAFSASATGTNYDPSARSDPSSYFPSTVTITPPTAPYVLRIHALVKTSASSPNYYGILVSSDATNFISCATELHSGGDSFVSAGTVSTSATTAATFPYISGPGSQIGQVLLYDCVITVTSSSLVSAGALVNGYPVGVQAGPTINATTVNLATAFTIYALGAASTDVVSAAYSTSLF